MKTPTGPENHEPRYGKLSAIVSFLVLAAVFSPIAENWKEEGSDGFPLSFYPMFTNRQGEVYRQTYLVGLDEENNRIPISYRYAGSGGFNAVRRQINRLARDDRVVDLCQSIASRVSRRRSDPLNRVERVRVVTGTYRLYDYFSLRKDTPVFEWIRAECPVRRKPQ
jgi:hypothetical protein